MKRKKVLFGAFAALAALSLTSCNNPVEPETEPTTEESQASKKYVIFNTKGGSEVAKVSLVDGKATKPADSTKEGFAFAGWFSDDACTAGNEFDFDATYDETVTAYAKWVKLSTYHEFMEANVGDTVAICGYIAARQSYYNGAVLYIYANEGAGFFAYQVPMTQEEYDNVYTVGKFVTIVGGKQEYSGELEISTDIIISANPYVADSTAFTPIDLTDKITEAASYQNAYFKATLQVAEYNPGDKEAASDNGAYGYNSSKTDATTGLPYDDLYFALVDENGDKLNCCCETYLDLQNTVRDVIMGSEFEVGATVEVTGFLYWYNGANPHITSIEVKSQAQYTATYHIDENTTEVLDIEKQDGFLVVPTIDNPANTEFATFGGWYADPECTIQFKFSEPASGNVDIYCKWNPVYENVTYELNTDSIYSGSEVTYAEDTQIGAFTATTNCLLRSQSSKNYDGKTYGSGIKLQNNSTFILNAPGKGTAELLLVDRGSLTGVNLTDADGNTRKISWSAGTVNGDSSSSVSANKVGAIKFDIPKAGNYTISLADGCGTPDICYVKMICEVQKAPKIGIEVSGAKADFLAGRSFEAGNIVVKLNYQNGRQDVLLAGDYEVDSSEVDFTKAGVYDVAVTYGSFSTTYPVKVYAIDSLTAYDHTITSGTYYTNPLTKVFLKDATFNHNNLSVHATGKCGNDTMDFLLTDTEFTVSTPDLTTLGKKSVTITAGDKETSYDINVLENAFAGANWAEIPYVAIFVDQQEEAKYDIMTDDITVNSINDAIAYFNAVNVPDNITKEVFISAGTYFEKVQINKPNYTLVGEGRDQTIIEFDGYNGKTDPSGKSTYSTIGSATLFVGKEATNFFANDLSINNWYNSAERYNELKKTTAGTQGVAVYCAADQAIFDTCKFSGYQDTLEAEVGRQVYLNCIIEGHTDFIFGNTATALFESCEIKVIGLTNHEKNNGYIFVTKGSGVKYGYIVDNCTFTNDGNVNDGSVSLGRTWQSSLDDKGMALIIMNSELGAHISKEAYNYDSTAENELGNMNDRFMTTMGSGSKYALHPEQLIEYNNTGAGAITESLEGTCTVITDPSTCAYMLYTNPGRYEGEWLLFLLEVFSPINGEIAYNEQWVPFDSPSADITLVDNKGTTIATLQDFAYVGGLITEKQINVKEYTEKDGYKFDGFFADAACTEEYDFTNVLAETNTIYLKFSKLGNTIALGEYNGAETSDVTATGWTVGGDGFDGTCNIAAVEGESTASTPASGTQKVNKVSPDKHTTLTSPAFGAATMVDVTITAASTATGNPVSMKFELLDAEGEVLVTDTKEVSTSKTRTTSTFTFESETPFVQVRVSCVDKHIGVAAISGTVYLQAAPAVDTVQSFLVKGEVAPTAGIYDGSADFTVGAFTISKGAYSKYSPKDAYMSLYSGNTLTFTVTSDGATFAIGVQSNNSNRNATLTGGETPVKKYLNGSDMYLGGTDEGKAWNDLTATKGWLLFENLKAGDYTVTFDTDESGKTGVNGNAEFKIEYLVLKY